MPPVDIVARPSALALAPPASNRALALADSLSDLNDDLAPVLIGYAKGEEEKARAKAFADAFSTSGAAFADAVRDGRLKPTQNPWYIKAYNEKAAQIRAQGEVSALVSAAQLWEEKDDPQAFNARWAREIGELAKNYEGVDAQKGFTAAANPLTQQILNSNVERNAAAIVTANVQNTTQLMSTALVDIYKKNPKASAADLYAAIAPYGEEWKATGGTEQQFNELTRGAFIAAASSVGDPDLLEALKDPRGGKGALYNFVDASGTPWSNEIEQARYRISRMQEIAGMGAVRKRQAEQELEGFNVQAWAYERWGWDLMAGKVPLQTLMDEARVKGFTPQGVQAFLQIQARDLSSNNTYMRAQTQQYGLDPGNQQVILSLRTKALKDGWSPALEAQVWEQVRLGMDEGTANDILTKADSTSKYFRSEAKADAREARANANFDRSMRQQANREFKEGVQQSIGALDMTLQGVGDKYLLNPGYRTQVLRGATDAGNAWLRSHPDDYDGALKATDAYLDNIAKQRLARLQRGPGQGTNSGGLKPGQNPRDRR